AGAGIAGFTNSERETLGGRLVDGGTAAAINRLTGTVIPYVAATESAIALFEQATGIDFADNVQERLPGAALTEAANAALTLGQGALDGNLDAFNELQAENFAGENGSFARDMAGLLEVTQDIIAEGPLTPSSESSIPDAIRNGDYGGLLEFYSGQLDFFNDAVTTGLTGVSQSNLDAINEINTPDAIAPVVNDLSETANPLDVINQSNLDTLD
ncbi:MAG: hypothetical protein AAF772_20715, partial [Acidobacteriota bacterium]